MGVRSRRLPWPGDHEIFVHCQCSVFSSISRYLVVFSTALRQSLIFQRLYDRQARSLSMQVGYVLRVCTYFYNVLLLTLPTVA